jgi:hypothetical protein
VSGKIRLLIFSLLFSVSAYAQETPTKEDSTKLYANIQTYSKKSKFAGLVYGLIFNPVAINSPKKKGKKKATTKQVQKPYSSFEGKVIRHIYIETLDPFGYSVSDTSRTRQNFLTNSGNKLHVKTQNITIRNLLLVRQNQKFDSLLLKESVRLVRTMAYIRDVSFFVKAVSKRSDSVDIFIRSMDKWSLIPGFAASGSRISISLSDNNFLGTGHEFQNGYTWNHSADKHAFNTKYFIPNIRNTYVNSRLYYGKDEFGNFARNVEIDRPFFSPYAKWAAGVNFSQVFRRDSLLTVDSVFVHKRFKYNAQDYWAGSAMQIFKGNTENDRTTNFVSAVRFLRIRYLERPTDMPEIQYLFSNENFYLASIGISTRKYVQDKFIFKYGVTEDVPVGQVFSITAGYQELNSIGRYYLGGRYSSGNYYPRGYLSFNIEYGTFFRAKNYEQGVISAGLNYFTGLFEIGRYKFRQFVKPQITIGINRFARDTLTLNDGYGLDGFNSTTLMGTSRMLISSQTQAYTPWNFFGFHFGPYLICSLGMLGREPKGFRGSRVYSEFGLGVLIKNDNLIINTFQISFAFFPSIPGRGEDIFKMNSFKTADFGFRDFEIGKPAPVVFQ